jgi:hypothetical protein
MGLFSRKNPYENEALELEAAMRTAPPAPDLRPRPAAPNMMAPQPPTPQVPTAPSSAAAPTVPPKTQNYGIEDAIQLMRELPDNKKEMVITIVQKTLVSARINVTTILDDASRKIEKLERKNEKLGQEIRELEEAILQRKLEMEHNARDIAETREVKVSFESAIRPAIHLDDSTFTATPFLPEQKAS